MATRVAALWTRKYKDKNDGTERTIVSGRTEYVMIPPGANIVLNKNQDKKNDKAPDFYLMCDEPYKKQESHQASPQQFDDSMDIPF